MSTGASSARIPVHGIELLHVIGFFVARFALFIVVLAVRLGACGERGGGGCRDPCASSERTKELTTSNRRLAFCFHCRSLLCSIGVRCPLKRAARTPRSRCR